MKNYKKIDHFEPIAMKCSQKQFEEIKPILEKFKLNLGMVIKFEMYPYLFNAFQTIEDASVITNRYLSEVTNEIVYNEWNAEKFLKACGIIESESTTKVRNSVLLQLADNNSYSEEILKKECPKLFDKKEIGNRLIEEAKKKGFVKGAMFYEFWIKDRICVVNDIEYTHSSLDLRSDGRCLYHNGQWAEIIETPTDIIEIVEKYGKDKVQEYLNNAK